MQVVRLKDLAIEEDLFDQNLNPIRARLTVSVEVMTSDDLGVGTKGGGVFLASLAGQERLREGFRADLGRTTRIARYFGDPLVSWRIADANGRGLPEELTRIPGTRLRIAVPDGMG